MNSKCCLILFLVFVSLYFSTPSSAQEVREYQTSEIKQLIQIKYGLMTLDSLKAKNVISATIHQEEQACLRVKARKILNLKNETDAELNKILMNVDEQQGINIFAKIKGFFSFVNIALVLSGILLVIAIAWLVNLYLWNLLKKIPIKVYEALIYLLCLLFMIGAYWFQPDIRAFIAFPGCLGLIGALTFSYHSRNFFQLEADYKKIANFFSWNTLLLSIIWSFVAVLYGSSLIGFIAILTVHSFLGFRILFIPGAAYLGFESEDVIQRSMIASLLMLIGYILLKYLELLQLPYIAVFAYGILFMGSFVYYLGLLIVSSKYYFKKNTKKYYATQAITIISGVLALFMGSVFEIPTLRGIGGTFFFIYLIEKYYEIPWNKIGWAWSLFGFAIFLYGFSFVVKLYPQYFFTL
jgi:hypothetical protein